MMTPTTTTTITLACQCCSCSPCLMRRLSTGGLLQCPLCQQPISKAALEMLWAPWKYNQEANLLSNGNVGLTTTAYPHGCTTACDNGGWPILVVEHEDEQEDDGSRSSSSLTDDRPDVNVEEDNYENNFDCDNYDDDDDDAEEEGYTDNEMAEWHIVRSLDSDTDESYELWAWVHTGTPSKELSSLIHSQHRNPQQDRQ